MTYARQHLHDTVTTARTVDSDSIGCVVGALTEVGERAGRLFFLGVAGSAGNASQAVNVFRKPAGFAAQATTRESTR